jgi:hypothetical protein
MARRRLNVFSLSFLDAMTCGFGAVVLFFMVINASVGLRAGKMTSDLQAEVDRLELEVLEGYKKLVEIRNSVRDVDDRAVTARGLATRLIEQIAALRVELATYEGETIAQKEHINRLKADLKSLEEAARRYSAAAPSEETPGDRLRAHIGDGDRQYLTGLKVGGERIFILVDASASMLGDTIVNIIRRRNLPDSVKIQADKWQQAVKTVDWVTTQIPRTSKFQIYTFNETAAPVTPGTETRWLDGGDREVLDGAVAALRGVVPDKGTNLQAGLAALKTMRPRPDNLILIVDGLPTQGAKPSRKRKVSGEDRLKLFKSAAEELTRSVPVNVVLLPMEGDPMAASAFWKLAIATGGSYMSPSKDWP